MTDTYSPGDRFPRGVLVTRGDIATKARVAPITINQWVYRFKDFPKPCLRTTNGGIWWWCEVEKWLRNTGRME